MAIAFFDFDRTLVCANTANLWLKSWWKQGRLSPTQALSSLGWLMCYNMGFVHLESGLIKAISFLKGESQDQFTCEVEQFYRDQVAHLYRPGGLKAVTDHKNKGDKVVLLTSSIHHLSDLVVAELDLDYGISTELEIDAQNRYTGRPAGGLCFGQGKVTEALKYAQQYQVSLADCHFYSDSMSDLPMMQAVGFPVAVSPDPRLKKKAEQQRWPIVNWD